MAASTKFTLVLACTLITTAGLASAQPSPDKTALELTRLRIAAEGHEKRNEHVACAETYMEIARMTPDAKGVDEVLYNAGVCFENGTLIGRAIVTYEQLVKRFPAARTSMKALVRIGNASAAIANFEKAAQAYESYAKRYGGERDAPRALASAITYRMALGDHREAAANIERFVKLYKKKLRRESADAQFGLAALYERQGDIEKMILAYQRYLKEQGKRGGTDRALIANAKIGAARWAQSCRVEGADGSCVRVSRPNRKAAPRKAATRKLPVRCGPESAASVQVLTRSPRLAKEAKTYFAKALSLRQRAVEGEIDEHRKASARHWAAASRFYSQQEDFESLLSLRFPVGLDFAPGSKTANESKRRFSAWIEKMTTQSAAVNESYRALNSPDAGVWAVAALARGGQSALHFSKLLQTAPIPKSVRTGPYAKDGVDAFCHALTAAAAPLEDQAIAAFGLCLELSKTLSHFDSWSRLCERQLALLRPEDFPPPLEFHRLSAVAGNVLTLAPLLSIPGP